MIGFGWIMTIILGALAGWIAEKVMKFDTGLVMNMVLGIAGALLGNFALGLLNIGLAGILGQLIVAVAGAC
ncbi:MAG: GlsB/YeaQ/YmgE family stress response membrane protein, partial [Aestuariivirga sp.]